MVQSVVELFSSSNLGVIVRFPSSNYFYQTVNCLVLTHIIRTPKVWLVGTTFWLT